MHRGIFALGVALAAAGCAGGGFSEDVGVSEGTIVGSNSLSLNGLALNSLGLNGLALNGISAGSIDLDTLAVLQDPGPTGELSRAFMKYAVGCAFEPSQSFSLSYVDASGVAHTEVYPGQLGVAPGWADGPLDPIGQRMVSACVAARVNYYQTPVQISIRSAEEPLRSGTTPDELADFSRIEGAFWGNLWAAQPSIHACHAGGNEQNSRAWKRDCAAGHLLPDGSIAPCGIIELAGPCASACQALDPTGQFYPSCLERPGQSNATTKSVVTIALPEFQ